MLTWTSKFKLRLLGPFSLVDPEGRRIVISSRKGAALIAMLAVSKDGERARGLGLTTHVIDHRSFDSRETHESEVLRVLGEARPDFIALAGYMRLLSPAFIAAYPMRILNIHPSLLPAFPGVDAQAQAIAYGVKVSGCTVHFVDEHLGRIEAADNV